MAATPTDDGEPEGDDESVEATTSTTVTRTRQVAETDEAFPVQVAAVGVGLVVLIVAALVTLVALAGDVGTDERVSTDAVSIEPSPTFDASIRPDDLVDGERDGETTLDRDISITDEPIVIDADGDVVDPAGGNGGDPMPSGEAATGGTTSAGDGELTLPDDIYTGGAAGGTDENPANDAGTTAVTTPTEPAETDDTDGGSNLLGGDSPEDKRMPDLICRGLQAAQDEIQDHGVFGSKSEDATGQGRRQIWDRNWIVVAQDPEPGAKIGEFDALLYVVKKGDDENTCP